MIVIDPTLLGRKFYTHDIKTVYICRGVIISGTTLLLGEYPDATYKCNRLATHKLSDVKFTDFVPASTPP
jgi:hypothetical protein